MRIDLTTGLLLAGTIVLLTTTGFGQLATEDPLDPPTIDHPGTQELGSLGSLSDAHVEQTLEVFRNVFDHAAVTSELVLCEADQHSCGEQTTLAGESTSEAQSEVEDGLELETLGSFETPRFWTNVAPISSGGDESVLRAHGYGAVAAMTPEGETLWQRTSLSFDEDWGIDRVRLPIIPIGTAPIDPFTWASQRAVAIGDLTGEGDEEVAISHLIRAEEAGQRMSVVTILDGSTGQTLWFDLYPGAVTNLLISEGTLLVGEETGAPAPGSWPIGEEGKTTHLQAIAFTEQVEGLNADNKWTFDTERPWARWLALEPLEDHVALAWTDKPLGEAGEAGRIAVLEADGTIAWEQATDGYPRSLHHDAGRQHLVVHEQADPVQQPVPGLTEIDFSYTLRALDAHTGTQEVEEVRDDALLFSLEVADANGDGQAEWVTGDIAYNDLPINGFLGFTPWWIMDTVEEARVISVDGADASAQWRDTTPPRFDGLDPEGLPFYFGLDVIEDTTEPLVVTAAYRVVPADNPIDQTLAHAGTHFYNFRDGNELHTRAGSDGQLLWQEHGDHTAFPLSVTHTQAGEEPLLVTMTDRLAVKTYAPQSGDLLSRVPLLADAFAANAVDIDDSGVKELILGTRGAGLFAVDSQSLDGDPDVLWRTTLEDSVREIEVADVTGDGEPEIVVAASTAFHTLSKTGDVLYTITYPEDFVWTLTLGDLTGDGIADIVVPTRTLDAYRGSDGKPLWSYDPTPAPGTSSFVGTTVVSDGKAAAAIQLRPQPGRDIVKFAAAVDGPTGEVLWEKTHIHSNDITRLWRSAVALPGEGVDGGDAVGIVYDRRNMPNGETPLLPVGWRQASLVYDLDSGQLLWESGPPEFGSTHAQAIAHDGDFLHLTRSTLNHYQPEGVDQTGLYRNAYSGTFADFGSTVGHMLLTGSTTIVAYESHDASGDASEHLDPAATWSGLHTEELFATDLDGDGTDVVVAHKQDDEARVFISSVEGTATFGGSSSHPFGLTLLQVQPTGGS